MKLVHPEIQSQLKFQEGHFPSLVIEHPVFFHRFVDDLYRQSLGDDGEAVFSIGGKPQPIHGNIDVTSSFFPFEVNRKHLLAKISADLEKCALSPEFYEQSHQLISSTEKWMMDIAFQTGADLEFPKLSIAALIKSAAPALREDFISLPEKILTYMELATNYKLARIFIFVNLRCLVSHDAMEAFTDTCCRKGFPILLIDNRQYGKLSREIPVIIDEELCEI